jgi:Domain of Unknown Function (DUF930)
MRRLVVTIGATLILASPATAIDGRFERSLRMLAPVDRLEQLCDYTAMQRIRKEHKPFRPDRAVAGARSDASIHDHTVVAKGGAFRSRKKWYALSYTCTAAPDHMAVTSFSYTIGPEIPEAKWASYGLWE